MPQKGHTNNPLGRKIGSPNKVTGEVRELLHNAFKGELENISTTLKKLTSKERLEMLSKFLPYIAPKLQTVTLTTDADGEAVVINETIISTEGYFRRKGQERAKEEPHEFDLSKLSDEELEEKISLLTRLRELEIKCMRDG